MSLRISSSQISNFKSQILNRLESDFLATDKTTFNQHTNTLSRQ